MSQQTDASTPFATRTYQSAWQWNDDETAKLMSAEEWLEEEADVDAAFAPVDGMDCDSAPNRGGIMLAIAKEIQSLRAERTQWANEFTQQTARLTALTAENERMRGPEGTKLVRVADEMLPLLSADWSEPVRIRIDSEDDGVLRLVCKRESADAAALPSSREPTDG